MSLSNVDEAQQSFSDSAPGDSGYSSDSSQRSLNGDAAGERLGANTSRRRRPSRPSSPQARDYWTGVSLFPNIYNFSGSHVFKSPQYLDHNAVTTCSRPEKADLQRLKDLVKYGPADLLITGWHLAPMSLKNSEFPPYALFPKPPHVLEVRFADTEEVSRFMCLTALEYSDRVMYSMLMHIRSLVVQAAANDALLKGQHSSISSNLFDPDALCPKWEENIVSEEEMAEESDFEAEYIANTSSICAVDVTVALLTHSYESKVQLRTLFLLHQMVDKCIRTKGTEILRCWGLQHVIRKLIKQIHAACNDALAVADRWLSVAVSLIYKVSLASSNIDLFLAALRWTCFYGSRSSKQTLCKLSPLLNILDTANMARIRIALPSSTSRGHLLSFAHLIGPTFLPVKGICISEINDESVCFLLTAAGLLKISLKPPFSIIEHDTSYTLHKCHGMFVEGDHLAVLEDAGGAVNLIRMDTLASDRHISPAASIKGQTGFTVYAGNGAFVSPYFLCGGLYERHAFFSGTPLTGALDLKPVVLPRSSDSLSVQFFIYPLLYSTSTFMRIVSFALGDRIWLSVSVSLNANNSTLKVIFQHGADVVAEVEEPIKQEWSLWSATLTSVSDIASWTVYRNGVNCDIIWKSGALMRSVTHVEPKLLVGSFSGYIASIQVWSRVQSISDMRLAATDGMNASRTLFLVCSFRMDEGTGCCLHSPLTGHVWTGTNLSWEVAPRALPVNPCASERVYWRPSNDEYHVITNEFEIAIVAENCTTWVANDGRIVEQQTSELLPCDLGFYCTLTGKLYVIAPESLGIRDIPLPCPPTKYIRSLPTISSCRKVSAAVMARIADDTTCTAEELALFVMHTLNLQLVTQQRFLFESGRNLLTVRGELNAHLRTLARLLDICKLSVERIAQGVVDFDGLLLCLSGRLLMYLVKQMERHCPSMVVALVVDVYQILQAHTPEFPYLEEASHVFCDLHKVVLAECVSHTYQLQLITESTSLKDLKQLLVPENLTTFVSSVIAQDLKKPFMTFLNRLKEECLDEAEDIFAGRPTDFDASSAMLATVLSMLAQKEKPQWHLVAVALVSSLCKTIVKRFEHHYPNESTRVTNIDLLERTFLGVALLSISHYLYVMEFDVSLATDVLKILNDTRNYLRPYTNKPAPVGKIPCRFVETYNVAIPMESSAPFHATLNLQHAHSIRLELNGVPRQRDDEPFPVCASLIKNEYERVSEIMTSGEHIFNSGGRLFVSCAAGTLQQGVSLAVHADVELSVESSDWLRDLCLALTHTIVRVINHTLLSRLPHHPLMESNSFLRGGLSNEVLRKHKIAIVEDDASAVQCRSSLCQLAEEGAGQCGEYWRNTYTSKRLPYSNRLEKVARWASCALTWHCMRPGPGVMLEQELSKAIEVIKRKAFLLLEALQQGRESDIIERARFLLCDVAPRYRAEAQLAEQQHTEEPIVGISASISASRVGYSRGRSVDLRSRGSVSHQRSGAETLDLSNAVRHGASYGFTSTRNTRGTTAAVKIFSTGLKEHGDSMSAQLFEFLINGHPKESLSDLTDHLLLRTQHAIAHTAAYRLLEELCRCYLDDHEMLSLILRSHLAYRLSVSEQTPRKTDNPDVKCTGDTPKRSQGFDHHYTSSMLGCGLLRELDLQKAACSFVQRSLNALLCKLDINDDVPLMEAIHMCATLCHPWDSVDMSILQPTDIFFFLRTLLSAAFRLKEASLRGDNIDTAFVEGKGLFDLAHQSLVIPNTMLQVPIDGVQLVDGEVQGLHVENANVIASARSYWKPLKQDLMIRPYRTDCDYYANYGLPCVVTELPEVQYFEITLDLSVQDNPKLSIGLSCVPFSPMESIHPDMAVFFSSNGLVTCTGHPPVQFSENWSVGDVIGCGVFSPHNSVFFTRNGEFLGVATNSTFSTLIPFVEARAQWSLMKIIVNFGSEQPFRFNIATLHCSCRSKFLTGSAVCDATVITVHYLVTMCFKNLSTNEEDTATVNSDAVGGLLEKASVFLRESIFELIGILNAHGISSDGDESDKHKVLEPAATLISRLFHCVMVVIECFRFDCVTSGTHSNILSLCATALRSAHDKWIKARAARCLSFIREMMREDSLAAAADTFKRVLPATEIVQNLVELARSCVTKERMQPIPPPKWIGNTTTVAGKGVFYAANPMPRKGTHMIGFRIRRRHQQGQTAGAPLGGCYYVGLSHGKPQIANMGTLISRSDVYVLQDTDDQDQVAHLLLRQHCIPRNVHRRIYGYDEVVWVELNADAGEITFYRENMILIGLAFSNVYPCNDLYPIVYHFNDDASCEIIPPPTLSNEPTEHWSESLRRSTAIHTLQQLHLVPYFTSAVSQVVHRSISQLDRDLESCLVSLAVLGGERSYLHCQHDSFGRVIVHSIAEVSGNAVIYVADDDERQLICVRPQTLKPSFIQTPLYASGNPEADACASLLRTELHRSLFDASLVAPLVCQEAEKREEIEAEYRKSIEDATTLDLIGIIHETRTPSVVPLAVVPGSLEGGRMQQSSSKMVFSIPPIVIELPYSTKSVYLPNPSVGVTTSSGCSIICGNVLLDNIITFAVSITTCESADNLMYVGLVAVTSHFPEQMEEVADWEDAWPLCSCNSAKTNSVNCCVEPNMVFGGNSVLYGSGDLLLVHVDRLEGTVAFSRVRKGRRVDFGVLFEGVPHGCLVRPFIVCGPDTVVVFSLTGGNTFPARNTFPVCNFNNPCLDAAECSACDAMLVAPWYGGEEVALCDFCFKTWQLPKHLFFIGKLPTGTLSMPLHLVSSRAPERLLVGSYVEFEENVVLSWSSEKSVNTDTDGTSCVSVRDEAFSISEPLSRYGNIRADISLSSIAGVPGHPFAGLLSFTPLWRDGQRSRSTCVLTSESLAVSSSIIPFRTKTLFSFQVTNTDSNCQLSFAGVFVGVSTSTDVTYTATKVDLNRLCSNNSVWGAWCDTSEKISANGEVFMLVDSAHGLIMISSTLGGLYYNPFIITCNLVTEDTQTLRLVVFSRDGCRLTSFEGYTSHRNSMEPSSVPIALGLVPENFTTPHDDVFEGAVVLLDTVQRTERFSQTRWKYSRHVQMGDGVLFFIGDILTIVQRGRDVQVLCQGLEIASTTLSEEQFIRRHRLMMYFSTRGLTASFAPPPYGRTHRGCIVQVHGSEVCTVESVDDNWEIQRFTVRRKDVRYCALAASCSPPDAVVEGARVAFRAGGILLPKRGSITDVQGNVINICEDNDDRTDIPLKPEHCFMLGNEGKEIARQLLYPLVTPPAGSITRVFEVGKTKYRLQSKASYNGIVFDCKASDTVELVGLCALSHTTGRHRVDVCFKKGSHKTYERDARVWTSVFSGLVDMHADRQFSVTLSPLHIEGGATFSIFLNTSHNCGVGFYSEDDGCHGDVGSELDSDGIITVFLGRKSESSVPFGDFSLSPQGFCGTITYKQSKGSKPPLIEDGASQEKRPLTPLPGPRGDVLKLVCRPTSTCTSLFTQFTVEVLKSAVRVIVIELPIIIVCKDGEPMGLTHYVVSVFYTQTASECGDSSAGEWQWASNSRVLLDGSSTTVVVRPSHLHLQNGTYLFQVALKPMLEKPIAGMAALLIHARDSAYEKRNSLISVRGLFGEVHAEPDAPTVRGELHTMLTGSFLNQNNSASYNGIMFDLRSKQDVTLEELFCISQTTADHVTVRLFWKEGSMEGAERNPSLWREVATKQLNLLDKQPFSVGPVCLRMKAHQMYSIFVNTTSSCGVRFYNSSDGLAGEIGEEFECDGILSVFVGRKSESSSPFAEIALEPRAFRGKILYRTYALNTFECISHALFSYLRVFLVTRILVALSSYVESSREHGGGRFSYERLLDTVATLATSPSKSVGDLEGAENMLTTLLKGYSPEELRMEAVQVPLASRRKDLFHILCRGDLALLTDLQAPSNSSLVCLTSNPQSDGIVSVQRTTNNDVLKVPFQRLIPVTQCWRCYQPYATTLLCTAKGVPHEPPEDEKQRLTDMLAHAVAIHYPEHTLEATTLAERVLRDPSTDLMRMIRGHPLSPPKALASPDATEEGLLHFQVSVKNLLPEDDGNDEQQFVCPFVFCATMNAHASLRFSAHPGHIRVGFITDRPLRLSEGSCAECYHVQLFAVQVSGKRVPLTEGPVLYVAKYHGHILEPVPSHITPCGCSLLQENGTLHLALLVQPSSLPCASPLVTVPLAPWCWEDGTVEAKLSPSLPTMLMGKFSTSSWPSDKPRSCCFMVASSSKERTVFLEVHVVEYRRRVPSLWDSPRTKLKVRRPFSLICGEAVTLGYSAEGDLFISDIDDVVRCRLTATELAQSSEDSQVKVGFLCIKQDNVSALLCVPDDAKRHSLASHTEAPATNDLYVATWSTFDPSRVAVSPNALVVSCSSKVGGQAVLGTPMPSTGVSAFILHIDRRDRPSGQSLGSGHFAGVAISTFSHRAPHFSDMKTFTDQLWVLQDIQDGDSLPNQAPIPPTEHDGERECLFCVGTKLLFIVDRNAGTLSLARDTESPHVVFHNIPPNIRLCPFVRLDHTSSSATLSPFSHSNLYSQLQQPSLEMAALSQPVTASLLRRFPLSVTLNLYPAFAQMLQCLPVQHAAGVERCWNDLNIHSRFQYRLSKAMEAMVELGCFSSRMMRCDAKGCASSVNSSAMQRILRSLSNIPHSEVAVFPGRGDDGSTEGTPILFRLPHEYEVIGRVEGTEMLRVMAMDAVLGPVERTLHLVRLDGQDVSVYGTDAVLPHTSVVRQCRVISSLNQDTVCGVITDGWYDGTLATYIGALAPKEERKVAIAVLCGLEHWHLHGIAHGHVMPENVYVRVEHGSVVSCRLWTLRRLSRVHRYASPILRERGVRSLSGDLWSCAQMIRSLTQVHSVEPNVKRCVELLEQGDMPIAEVLHVSESFQDVHMEGGEGPSITLRTGTRLRGGSGSYNGIMFDVVAKHAPIRLTRLTFFPDTNSQATVSLFTREGTFVGAENNADVWTKVVEKDMVLSDNVETAVEGFEPVNVPAGGRIGIFLHTTSGSGVLFYSESEGIHAGMGQVEEANNDVGITVGKKCESSKPFTAIQCQKRLLKGSLTYTLIIRSHGPRSCLVHTSDNEVSLPAPFESPTLLGPVVIEDGNAGICVQSHENESLILVGHNQLEWVYNARLAACTYAEVAGKLQVLEDSLAQMGQFYNTRCARSSRRCAGSVRPLYFSNNANAGNERDGTTTVLPILRAHATWVSEPITGTCTISLWRAKRCGSIAVHIIQGNVICDNTPPSAPGERRITLDSKGYLFLHVDHVKRCIAASSVGVVRYLKGDLSVDPVRILLSLAPQEGGPASSQVFAYVDAGPTVNAQRVCRNATLIFPPTNHGEGTSFHRATSLDDTIVTWNNGCNETAEVVLSFDSVVDLPVSVHTTVLTSAVSPDEPLFTQVVKDTAEVKQAVVSRNALGYLVEARQLRVWTCEANIFFLPHLPSLYVSGRTVRQVAHSASSKCVVSKPHFLATKIHHVTLRVVCSLKHPVEIFLEHPVTTASSMALPFCMFDDLYDTCFGSTAMKEVIVHLYIDFYSKRALVYAEGGTVFDILSGCRSCPEEMQLGFLFHAPGSIVEVLEWRHSNPSSDLPQSPERLEKAIRKLNVSSISANVSHSVGAIQRHSPGASSRALRETGLSATKQMEVLIISYARLLLQKALVSQEAARVAVRDKLHYLLSFTSLRYSTAVQVALENTFKQGVFSLIAQSCAHLLAPAFEQTAAGAETSVNVLSTAMSIAPFRDFLTTPFGPTLTLLLLRTATTHTRSTRHLALKCAQDLLSNSSYPLPAHKILCAHLRPLLRMMNGLCKRGKMASAVVQIGVTMVADLTQRYKAVRPGIPPPGQRTCIPFQIVVCAREAISAITQDPPRQLPAALARTPKTAHRILCEVKNKETTEHGYSPCFAVFTEECRDAAGSKSFEVTINGSRKGFVIIGWDIESPSQTSLHSCTKHPSYATEDEPLPSCGYAIEPTSGKVFVCLGRSKETSPLKVKARAGDVISVACVYPQQSIQLSLYRGQHKELTTNFQLCPDENIALPFFYAQHMADATLRAGALAEKSGNINVLRMYGDLQENPHELDAAPAQSFDFYVEVNLFTQLILKKEQLEVLESADEDSDAEQVSVPSHEIASYTLLSKFLGVNAFSGQTPVWPLRPYVKRLKLFDALTATFCPLINLKRPSELFDIFRTLKHLCSKDTEEMIQSDAMRPYQNRQGRKVHVTIHSMQAQPSAAFGPHTTLMRSVFGQLYMQLHRTPIDTFYASPLFTVKLAGFGSTDAGGPYRDVLSQLANEIMTTHPSNLFQLNPLFMQCGRGGATAIMPNPNMISSTPHMLEFFGKLLASFFITNDILAVEFPPLFWKQLLNEKTPMKDLLDLDPDIMKQLAPAELMERTSEELEARFPGISETWRSVLATNPHVSLGTSFPPNTAEGAKLLSDRIVESELGRFADAMGHIQQGFNQVVPVYTLQAFRWKKVEFLICGTQKLSFEAFRDECDIQLPQAEAAMFLSILESMTDEDRTFLLRFTTGQSRLPLKSRIKVQHNGTANALPTSSTCFFTLRIPTYTSANLMKERLLYAIRHCQAIDADGQARENIILDM